MPVSSLVLIGPRAAVAVAGRVRSGAITNARSAARALGAARADRAALAPADDDDRPGALTRIPRAEALELLAGRSVGRLAYVARSDAPDVVPVNFTVHDGDIYIRSGVGPKLQAAERRAVVVVEVDDIDESSHTGWSVVAAGRAERLSVEQVRALPDEALPATWARGPRLALIRVRPTRVEGRRLH